MRVTAVIPARGGSKGVPGKNLAHVGTASLLVRAIRSVLESEAVDEVVVSTDAADIAAEAVLAGALVVRRPAHLAGDLASSESAVVHALDERTASGAAEPDVVVLVQCTSPFLDPRDLDRAVTRVLDGAADAVFAAAETHSFVWRDGSDGAVGVNHDHNRRLMRQERDPEVRETGAFYVMRAPGLREHGHRFFGRIGYQLVPDAHAMEVDTHDDLRLARMLSHVIDDAEPIDVDAIVTDFDGVHTDDRVHLTQDGRESVTVSRSDGMGISLIRRAGLPFLILSTERNPVVRARAEKLGVPVLQGVDDKAAALHRWIEENGLDPARVAYLGNDVNDIGCLELVGWPVVVPDAHPRARNLARVVLTRSGGDGAVRDLCDRVLAARKALV